MAQHINTPAPAIPYFTPYQSTPVGASLESPDTTPTLFRPLQIRSCKFPNRIWCAPMCMYSSDNGAATDFHLQHLGSIATRGAGLVMVEATAVTREGRISMEDMGLWCDEQIEPLRRVATYIHSQSKHISLQLAHAGRKASTVVPWLGKERGKSILMHSGIGGWSNKVVGPSPIKWSADHALPHELSIAQISDLVSAFVAAAQRAVTAGIDSLEIHAAHGYLIHSFLSGASNTRNDAYGGSFNNRIRLLMEVIDAVRVVIPDSMPLFVRVSATDWLQKDRYPTAWDIPDTIKLAKLLYERGVDLIDVSSGGNHEFQQIPPHNEHQIEIAGKVRAALKQAGGEAAKLLVAAVGGISNGIFANSIVDEDNCPARTDVVFAGRAFLRDSGFALACADDLNIRVQWPLQYLRKGDRKYSRL